MGIIYRRKCIKRSTKLLLLIAPIGLPAHRWDDFRLWVARQFNVTAADSTACSQKLELFLYDGQDPPGPTLRSVQVELSDIDPALAAGGSENALVATLQTRWPNAAVVVEGFP